MTKKEIRAKFRASVFTRDKNQCVMCGAKGELDAHHITDRNEMPNGGYILENGISLCPKCHLKAEQYHISGGKKWEEGFHPNELYKKINSSYELASHIATKGKIFRKDDFEIVKQYLDHNEKAL